MPLQPRLQLLKRSKLLSQLWIVLVLYFLTQIISTNANAQLRQVYLDAQADNHVQKISFYSPSSGFVAFTQWLGYTTDSGRTFTQKYITNGNVNYNGYSVNLTFGFSIKGVKAFTQDSIIVYGDYGLVPSILYSTNGGNTFKLIFHDQYDPFQLSSGITDIIFPNNNNIGYAIDADRILKTADKGASWYVVRIDPQSYFDYLEASYNNIYAISVSYAHNKLLKSANAGSTWQQISVPAGQINYAYFLTANNGWLNITNGTDQNVYYTSNGGGSWIQKNATPTSFYCKMMKFTNDSTGYGITGVFDVYKTTDSGRIWEPLPRDNNYSYLGYSFNDIQCLSNTQFWAGGGHGFLEVTTNSGGSPLPKAYFAIDTTNFYSTNIVNLKNYSKTTYSCQWFKNNVLISTAYNYSYPHDASLLDSIKLVVSNGINTDTSIQSFYFDPPPPSPLPYTGWMDRTTNINDNLVDVRFFGNYGLILGEHGVYYTTTGANNTTGWEKFTINTSDSVVFKRSKFKQIAFNDKSAVFYICGKDTGDNLGVLFQIDLSNLSYNYLYGGGYSFNSLIMTDINYSKGYLQAVGDWGYYLSLNLNNYAAQAYIFPGHQDLKKVYYRNSNSSPTSIGIISDSTLFVGGNGLLGFTLAYTQNMGRSIKDISSVVGQNDFAINDNKLFLLNSATNFYSVDSLTRIKATNVTYNVLAAANYNVYKFIGTNQGIFKVNYYSVTWPLIYGTETIEYQPTSLGKSINSIWFKYYPQYDTGYAVGNNGVLFKTVNYGGPSVPISEILTTGNCLGDYTWLAGKYGTGTSCKWYLDNNFISDNCNSFPITISTPGLHTLKYIVSNNYGMADTSYKTISISPVPSINLPVTVSDTILCKSEPVIVSIQNSQAGYNYQLIQKGTGTSFGSAAGNGTRLYFPSLSISKTAYYYIRVTDIYGGCSKNFTDSFYIRVEHTKSNFSADKINIASGEPLSYFQHDTDAQSYLWNFGPDANTPTSTSPTPQNISYSTPGQKTLTLISTSINGCTDTLTTNAVFVYVKPNPEDACYAMNVDDSDYYASNTSINKLILHAFDNGYFICGNGSQALLKTKYGISKKLSLTAPSYLASYTTDGALSWLEYISTGTISSVVTDKKGNTYLTGYSSTKSYYYFNNGDSLLLTKYSSADTISYLNRSHGFILKIDSTGKYLWHRVIIDTTLTFYQFPGNGTVYPTISIRDSILIVTGFFNGSLSYCNPNTNSSTTVFSLTDSSGYNRYRDFVLKLKTDGSFLWGASQSNSHVNSSQLIDAKMDATYNTYVTGYFEDFLAIRDVNNQVKTLLGSNGNFRAYVYKLNASGQFVWAARADNNNTYQVKPCAIEVDSLGNSYITGRTGVLNATQYLQVTSSNGAVSNISLGSYFLFKFKPNGILSWANGIQYSSAFGTALHLKGNNIYTAGAVGNSGTFIMTSTDGLNQSITNTGDEVFVVKYDTSGNLKNIYKSGVNTTGYLTASQLLIDANQNFLMSGYAYKWSNVSGPYTFFNNYFSTNKNDAFFSKINPNFCYNGSTPVVYTFIGDGNWTVASNWSNNLIPPAILPYGYEIVINHVVNGQCILNTSQQISSGAKITVVSGKTLTVAGNLLIQ